LLGQCDPVGDSAAGQVGEALAHGWVRLDTTSRYPVRPGFSGGGLWSRDYRAVVGVVGQVNSNGDGHAVTLHEADSCLPGLKIKELARWSAETAGDVALSQWGWTLSRDPEGIRHWQPRARGVSSAAERGYRFRGQAAALTRIVSWLGRSQPDRSVLVVTGSPGVGKSAVLGRIVTTADPGIRASLPADDQAVLAEIGSVSCQAYLERLSLVGGLPASGALTALAFAEAPGLTARLWQAAVHAIYRTEIGAGVLAAFARSAAANFLVESGSDDGEPTPVPRPRLYRLFH
jgi:hypothetical protein